MKKLIAAPITNEPATYLLRHFLAVFNRSWAELVHFVFVVTSSKPPDCPKQTLTALKQEKRGKERVGVTERTTYHVRLQ